MLQPFIVRFRFQYLS